MSPEDGDEDRSHAATRGALRLWGPIVCGVGAILMIVAFVDFFSNTGRFEQPKRFWLFFVAMPVIGLGSWMCRLGYMGTMRRYMDKELGRRRPLEQEPRAQTVRCRFCGRENARSEAVCGGCGAALAS